MDVDEAVTRRGLKCPRCGRVVFLDPRAGGVGTRCPSCGGVHLRAGDVDHLIGYELGVSASELREKAETPADGGEVALCSTCEGPLSVVTLEGVTLDLCLRCGAGWLDPGELERLTHGRHLERAPPNAMARAFLPKVIKRSTRRAVIARPIKKDGLFGALVAGGLPAACAGSLLGSPVIGAQVGLPLLFGGVVLWGIFSVGFRGKLVVDFELGEIRALHLGVPPREATLRLEEVRAVVVVPYTPLGANGKVLAWHVAARLHNGDDVRWFTTPDRVLAHRLAFQASQVLEVPVETPPDDEDAP